MSAVFYTLLSHHVFAMPVNLNPLSTTQAEGHLALQLGGFWSDQGKHQHIAINGMAGDIFTISNQPRSNVVLGVGYYLEGQKKGRFNMSYGLNAFYLAKTKVSGSVLQENEFENLTYSYNITQFPLYAVAKSTIDTSYVGRHLTIDVGVGPNFMQTSYFTEQNIPVGSAISIEDEFFSNKTTTTFSATAGVGLKFDQVFGNVPLECGYRFFYLGQGGFKVINDQLEGTLKTGNIYTNAVMCSIMI